MKNKSFWILILISSFYIGCGSSKKTLKVAATPVPQAELLEFVKKDLANQGIDLEVVVMDDYNLPNRVLAAGEVDANFFQHKPFLQSQIQEFAYPIVSIASIEVEPMGVYSSKITKLSLLRDGSTVAIPNDPSNETRALLLLQKGGLITLDTKSSAQPTVANILRNPKHLKILEVDAAMLPRTLKDVDIAVINTNFALQAGLSPDKNALLLEDKHSPYVNVLVVRSADAQRADLQALAKAMTSPEMKKHILERYNGAIIPAF